MNSSASRAATRLALALATLGVAGCGPDRVTALNDRPPPPVRPAASIENLTAAPILYDQHSTTGPIAFGAWGSQLWADDFTVPAEQTWSLGHVAVSGILDTPTLTFSIRADDAGHPGAVLPSASFTLAPTTTSPTPCCSGAYTDYLFTLTAPVTLGPGTYWLVLQERETSWIAFRWIALWPQIGLGALQSLDGGPWSTADGLDFAFVLYQGGSPQTITLTSVPPSPAIVGAAYTVSATGGASGNPVVITASLAGVCTASGTTVRFVGVGTCTVAADQAGNAGYEAAAQVTQTVPVDYAFDGFSEPVDNGGVLNVAKAGQAIALKWRLTDATGAPVTTLTKSVVTVKNLSCALVSTQDQVEEYAAGGSGLQNLGDGYYQLNWKAPTSYANSCKTLQLNLGEGSGARTANFAFTK